MANSDTDTDSAAAEQNRDFVTSLAKGLAVIQAFGPSKARMTLTEVAAETELSRAGARRLLLTLENLGFVVRGGRYFELSPKVLELGFAFLASHNFAGVVQRHLESVTEELQEACSLAVLQNDDIVYVSRSDASHRLMSISLSVGSRLPAAFTSMGRVLLAAMPDAELDAFLDKADLRRYTERTTTDKATLKEILHTVRATGYCIVDQELEPALRSLAVPVLSAGGSVVAALNVSTNAGRVPIIELEQRYLPVLKRCADAIRPFMA
ncbi:MAG: IclR family transcriptional regulator C-terminal domain-containing protein [Aquisalimonadaceae bacterium]